MAGFDGFTDFEDSISALYWKVWNPEQFIEDDVESFDEFRGERDGVGWVGVHGEF